MSILLALAGLCALVLAGCVAVLFCANRNLNRAFDVLSFSIRLAEQNSHFDGIERKEGTE